MGLDGIPPLPPLRFFGRPLARPALVDAALYGCGALVALALSRWVSVPLERDWGRVAVWPYSFGSIAALFLAVRSGTVRARAWLAVGVLVGAMVVPMALEVAWRAQGPVGLHAQSEVIVTEEAAAAVEDGHDPYATSYAHGPLADRPVGTKTHFPYLPAMLLFGLPRAVLGPSGFTDARVFFVGVALALLAASLALSRASGNS